MGDSVEVKSASSRFKVGVYLGTYGRHADPSFAVEVAAAAEAAGWNGLFVYDVLTVGGEPTINPWMTLAAIAQATRELTLGVAVAKPALNLPVLAQQSATLAALAPGRVVLGLGSGLDVEFRALSDAPLSLAARAAYVDLALDVLPRLWRGEELSGEFRGRAGTRRVEEVVERWSGLSTGPFPLADPPRIWLGGSWPNKQPMRRADRADGIFPARPSWTAPLEPAQLQEMIDAAPRQPDDVVMTWTTEPGGIGDLMSAYPHATWYLEAMRPEIRDPTTVMKRVRAGPA